MSDTRERVLILGLGNTMLADDGVGVKAARLAEDLVGNADDVTVRSAEIGGFALLDLIDGFDRLVVIDAAENTRQPTGTVLRLDLSAWESGHHLVTAHGVDLPTALALGECLGMRMPTRTDLVLVAVEDPWTCSDSCSERVSASIPAAAELALRIAEDDAA